MSALPEKVAREEICIRELIDTLYKTYRILPFGKLATSLLYLLKRNVKLRQKQDLSLRNLPKALRFFEY